jgi:hypothetical protein
MHAELGGAYESSAIDKRERTISVELEVESAVWERSVSTKAGESDGIEAYYACRGQALGNRRAKSRKDWLGLCDLLVTY